MKIKILQKCIKEFGIWGGCRIVFYWMIKIYTNFSFKNLRGGGVKIRIKRLKQNVYIRPDATDIFLLLDFFCRENGKNGEVEYNIDFSGKLDDAKFIIDAGANIGLFSLIYADKFPNATIIAIEPEIENYNYLMKNTMTNKNIHCIKAGLWCKNAILKVHSRDTGEWGFIVKECLGEEENTIRGISIESIMKEYEIPTIDILKMDIEGSEYEIFLSNNRYWLEKTKVLIVETHERIKPGVEELTSRIMKEYGYQHEINGENQVYFKK